MAFDWIKVEHTTPDKQEVVRMAEILNLDPDLVLGKLLRVWIWADQNTTSGNLNVTNVGYIDRIAYCPGFGAAMVSVGWLAREDGSLSFPNFTDHNSESSKKRAVNAKKVRKHRSLCNQNVTEMLPEKVTPSTSTSISTSISNSKNEENENEATPHSQLIEIASSTLAGNVDFTDLPPELSTSEFKTLWCQWEQYLKAKHDRVMGLMQRSPAWHEMIQRAPPGEVLKFAMSTVRQAIANGWKGLYPKEEKNHANPGRHSDPRTGVTRSAGGGRYEGIAPKVGVLGKKSPPITS